MFPDSKTFDGNVYVLINNNTASACEPVVYALKNTQNTVVIGEKTAGAMLNGERFSFGENFTLWIPTAEYFTSDGFRIDKVGVESDIKAKSGEEINSILGNLLNKKSVKQ